MRLFIAINIPKKERTRIHRAARPLREEALPVGWVEPDKYHITLKFLGDVRPDRLEAVSAAVEQVAAATKAFRTVVSGFGAFPTIRRPRVIWIGIGATPELRCLKQDLEWALGDFGFEPETRAFHPHVTLGRVRGEGGAGAFRGLDSVVAEMSYEGELRVHSVDLMRSRLSKEGAEYTLVAGARLASG